MGAHYDSYDYSAYWEGREYEHASEEIAIKALITEIPKITTVCEIGAGYGRLTPTYLFRAKKVILVDPSAKNLSLARKKYRQNKKVEFLQSTLENLPEKIKKGILDLVILVRVLHHLQDLPLAIKTINDLLKEGGYLVLEFANKEHFKATISELSKGNLTYPIDITTRDIRSESSLRKKTIPFLNYHPDFVKETLITNGFKIVKKLSVSNIRSPLAKKFLSTNILVSFEKYLQRPLSYINFGPSIFLLARKTT